MKKTTTLVAAALAVAMTFALGACGGKGGAKKDAAMKIGIITTSGVDDGSFNQNCYDGIKAFIASHPTATVRDIKEPDMNKCISAVADVVADYDALVLPGFNFAAIGDIAKQNPKKKFILVDSAPTDAKGNQVQLDNVYSMTFAEQESGFFAGIAAALQSKTGKVAVVNGIAYPSNVNYQYGFMSGVNYANAKYGTKAKYVEIASYAGKDVKGTNVGGNYIGSFADEATGKVVGNALIAKGCDIIFVAAGSSGNGVFAAAKEAKNVFIIGCDVDQYKDGASGSGNIILTSALKVMDVNVTKQLTAIADGTFKGANDLLTASTDSTGYVSAEGHQQLSPDSIAKLKEAYDLLKQGKVVPAANFNGHMPTDFPGLK
jgi:basic membrane protein A